MLYDNGPQNVVHIPAASASPGDLLETNTRRPHPTHITSDILELAPTHVLKSLLGKCHTC